MFQSSINRSHVDFALVSTSTTISLDYSTSGIASVAFTTDGSDGQFTLTIADAGGTNFAAVATCATATLTQSIAPLSKTATTVVFVVSDLATPTVVNLASVDVTVDIMIVKH